MSITSCRSLLVEVGDSLRQSNSAQHHVQAIQDALGGTDVEFAKFLESNELWGGAGSIADTIVDMTNPSGEADKRFNRAMYALGLEQLRIGVTNFRTAMCVKFLRRSPRTSL